MSEKTKVLVCGDVEGKFKILFKRVESVNQKSGPFDFLLCVGDFFGSSAKNWKPYQDGIEKVPIPTYILGPNSPEQAVLYPDKSGDEICPNVSYLGKRGLFSGLSGVKLAYVSGIEGPSDQIQEHTYAINDVTTVRDICVRGQPSFRGVDILATSTWPAGIMNLDERKGLPEPRGSSLLSWLAVHIKPRYHFCAREGFFYERRPYGNHSKSGDTAEHATRFIALAKVGNPNKEKWLYAFSIDPIDRMKASILYQPTTDQTYIPYTGSMLQDIGKNSKQEEPAQFFYDMKPPTEENTRKRQRKEGGGPDRKQRPTFDQGTCWFCLASPEVEKHLIITIGTEVYLALAKGGLLPDHVLILPVVHHQALSCVPESIMDEIKQFQDALKKFYRTFEMVPVFFERNYKTSHLQIQAVPVSSRSAGQLKDIFQEYAEAEGFQLDELPEHAELNQIAQPGTPYFYVELPTGQRLFHRIKKNFPLQFGRDVLASESVLNMADRADWRDCKVSKDEEAEMVKKFRSRSAYDEVFKFTLS
ncbi:CWF19-like protein 1 [Anabrus simplex]|uniref:CWF19-like protein 1 n=1 Tax=Anabrus simplex TaxID=316456 RepID=UPI0035A33099